MGSFWGTFLGGLASGVVLLLLTHYIYRRARRQLKSESAPTFNIKEPHPYIPLIIGLALFLLGLFGGEKVAEFSVVLIGWGLGLLLVASIFIAVKYW
jgi:hypothetical protein